MSVNLEDWEVDFDFPNFNLAVNENEANVETES